MRGFTPPIKQPPASTVASSCTPQSGLTSATSLTTHSVGSRSLSDQTIRSRPFTSSHLSLPHGGPPQGSSLRASCVLPSSRETLTEPSGAPSLAYSRDDPKHTVTGGTAVQKSSPPIAFVAPVVSNPAMARSVMYQIY